MKIELELDPAQILDYKLQNRPHQNKIAVFKYAAIQFSIWNLKMRNIQFLLYLKNIFCTYVLIGFHLYTLLFIKISCNEWPIVLYLDK